MEINRIVFLNSERSQIKVESEDSNGEILIEIHDYNLKDKMIKKLVDNYGGEDEIAKSTVRELREYERREEIEQAIDKRLSFTGLTSIDFIINEDLDKSQINKIKLSMYRHDFVKNSKNVSLLKKLRQTDNIIDLIMYFGMIREDFNQNTK